MDFLTWIFLLVVGTQPTPYTCTTDTDCQAQCEARHETHCNDPFYNKD